MGAQEHAIVGISGDSVAPLRLPPGSLKPSLAWFLFTILLQVASSVVLIVVIFVDFILQPYNDSLTATGQILYTIPITIVATGVAIVTETEIRKLWAYLIVHSSPSSPPSEGGSSDQDRAARARKTAVLLGLSSLTDMARTFYIPMALGISGLVTTAIVTGLQPSAMVVVNDMPLILKPGRNVTRSGDSKAVSLHDSACFDPSESEIPGKWFRWNLTDGEQIGVGYKPQDDDDALAEPNCAAYSVLDSFKTLDDDLGFDYHGIHIERQGSTVPLAEGRLPRVMFSSQKNQASWWDAKETALGVPSVRSFQWAWTCVPALARSVASCRRAGTLDKTASRIGVTSGNCTVERSRGNGGGGGSQSFPRGEMVAGACTGDRPLGTATILIGATGEYAGRLQEALYGSPGFDDADDKENDNECTVVCDIDVRSSLSFRGRVIRPATSEQEVSSVLEVKGADLEPDGSNKEPYTTEGWADPCTAYDAEGSPLGVSKLLTDPALAVAAAASWQLLAQSYSRNDGLLTTLMHVAENSNLCPGYGSEAANSCMEELLTMASRIALGFYYGEGTSPVSFDDIEYDSLYSTRWISVWGGRRASTSVRVGISEPWAIVFVLPMVLATAVLLVLWIRVRAVRDDGYRPTQESDS